MQHLQQFQFSLSATQSNLLVKNLRIYNVAAHCLINKTNSPTLSLSYLRHLHE